MKGTIVRCLKSLVEEKAGQETWDEIVTESGVALPKIINLSMDIPDGDTVKLLESACKVLGLTLSQAADAFGKYWMTEYAPAIYKSHFDRYRDARAVLLGVDDIHRLTTATVPNAHPPRFDYEEVDDRTLDIVYNSSRGMIDLLMGLARGVGAYFNERLTVSKVGSDRVRVRFS